MPVDKHRSAASLLVVAIAVLGGFQAQAQSVQPNRYGGRPQAGSETGEAYRRHRQAVDETERRQHEAVRRAGRDRIALAIDANRRRMEAARARTDRLRAQSDAGRSERMRLEFESRRQAYERQREELERQRAELESRPAPAQAVPPR